MTLGLSDSLSLTPATLLNTRVGYSGSLLKAPGAAAWRGTISSQPGEESKELKVDLQQVAYPHVTF